MILKRSMGYNVRHLVSFEKSFAKINREAQKRIAEKIDALADHPETIGSPMKNLPQNLHGLHKIRAGDWRVFFWVDRKNQEITLYDIDWRDKAYKRLLN